MRLGAETPVERVDQPWRVLSLAADAGLSEANVFTLDFARDASGKHTGTVWLATSDGLREYDGFRWRRHGRTNGLPSDFVRCVLVTRTGVLWLGTDRGVGTYDGRSFQPLGSEGTLAGPNVRRIIEAPDGAIWFCSDSWPDRRATGGLTRYVGGAWETYHVENGLPGNYVVNFHEDVRGRRVVATLQGVAVWDSGKRQWKALALPVASALRAWGSGCFAESLRHGLLVSNGETLFRLDGSGDPALLESTLVHTHGICSTPDGRVFAAGRVRNGWAAIFEWDSGRWNQVSSEFELARGYTEEIRVAPDGALWVMGPGCLVRWTRDESRWREVEGIGAPLGVDADGAIWFGRRPVLADRSEILVRWDGTNWHAIPGKFGGLALGRGGAGTWGWNPDSMVHWDKGQKTSIPLATVGLSGVEAGITDRSGGFWAVGPDRDGRRVVVSHRDGVWSQPRQLGDPRHSVWRQLTCFKDGIWVGATDGVTGRSWATRVTAGSIEALELGREKTDVTGGQIHCDLADDVWIYGDTGVHRFRHGRMEEFESIPNLAGRQVTAAVENQSGVWFQTSGAIGGRSGVSVWSGGKWTLLPIETTGRSFVGRDDAVLFGGRGRFFIVPAGESAVPIEVDLPIRGTVDTLIQDAGGEIWVGVGGRTLRYRPDRIAPVLTVHAPSRVAWDGVLLARVEVVDAFQPRETSSGRRFSWRVDGGPWGAVAKSETFEFGVTGLKPGIHRVDVRCADHGLWSEPAGAGFEFLVHAQPIQDKRWFMPVIVLSLASMMAVAGIAWTARRRLAGYAGRLKAEVSARTEELAADVEKRRLVERSLRMHGTLLNAVVDGTSDAIFVKDKEGRYMLCNRAAAELIGRPAHEVLGKSDVELLSKESAASVREHDQAVMDSGAMRSAEETLTSPGGTRTYLVNKAPYRDDEGQCVGIFGIAHDITDRKRAETLLAEREELLRLFVRHAPVGIAMFDGDMRLIAASDRWEVETGASSRPGTVAGGLILEVWSRAHQQCLRGLVEQVAEQEVDFPDGTKRWLRWEARPWYRRDGAVGGSVIIGEDITRRRRNNQWREIEHGVARILADSNSFQDAMPAILKMVSDQESWVMATHWERDDSGTKLRCSRVWHGDVPSMEPLVAFTKLMELAADEGMPGRVLSSEATILVPDISQDPQFLRAVPALAAGIRSAVGFPIRVGGRLMGVMDFLSLRPIEPARELEETLTSIGAQIGQFIVRKMTQDDLHRFVAMSPVVLYVLRVRGEEVHLHWVSPNLDAMTGYTVEEARATYWWSDCIHPDDRERVLAANPRPYTIDHQVVEFRFRRKNGDFIWLRDEKRLSRNSTGESDEINGAWTDITSRVVLEAQLRQAQKMEAIGLLSGGIAHDFNNILGAILGNAQLAAMDIEPGHPAAPSLDQIMKAGGRGAALVRQILAFARRQPTEQRSISLGAVVDESVKLLRSTLPAAVKLVAEVAEDVPEVVGDENQIQQVVLNLGTNGWHALEGQPGTIRVALSRVVVEEALASMHPGMSTGPHACLSISDTGKGMDATTVERIFEPFFTTKKAGEGTGLGLAVVHGIVTAHHGVIFVHSAPGTGSTFEIYLPQAPDHRSSRRARKEPIPRGHGEEILVVDDEEPIMRASVRILDRIGYRAVGQSSAGAALDTLKAQPGRFHLVLTDLNMPGLSGIELARLVNGLRPDLPVILTSGMISDELRREAEAVGVASVLLKPAGIEELAQAVSRTINPTSHE